MNIIEKIDAQLDSYRDAMVEMQKKLTAFAAVGPDSDGPGEMEKAMWLKQWMIDNEQKHRNPYENKIGYRDCFFVCIYKILNRHIYWLPFKPAVIDNQKNFF